MAEIDIQYFVVGGTKTRGIAIGMRNEHGTVVIDSLHDIIKPIG